MKPTYLVRAWGRCSNYDPVYKCVIENLSLGALEGIAIGAKSARLLAGDLENEIKQRANHNSRGVQTYHELIKQTKQKF